MNKFHIKCPSGVISMSQFFLSVHISNNTYLLFYSADQNIMFLFGIPYDNIAKYWMKVLDKILDKIFNMTKVKHESTINMFNQK